MSFLKQDNQPPDQAVIATPNTLIVRDSSGRSKIVDPVEDQDIASAIYSRKYAGMQNDIINGDLSIWQVGYGPLGAAATKRYLADMMFTHGNTSTLNPQAMLHTVGGEIEGCQYYHRTTVASIAGANNYAILSILLDDKTLRKHAGKTVTLSFYAKMLTGTANIAVEYQQTFGTGGPPSSSGYTYATTHALTTSWVKKTCTFAVPSITGKTFGTDNGSAYGMINIWFDAGSNFNSRTNSLGHQSGTFDISTIQLTVSDVALPFIHRDVNETRRICQSYYLKDILFSIGLSTVLNMFYYTTMYFPSMRRSVVAGETTYVPEASGFIADDPVEIALTESSIMIAKAASVTQNNSYYRGRLTIDQRY